MRERAAACEACGVRQRGGARGDARTMNPCWLWAAVIVVCAAWRPSLQPLEFAPRLERARTRRHVPLARAADFTHDLHVFGWHLQLQENKAIRSPYYDGCQFYKGRVLDEAESTASVTECNGQLYGLVQIGREEFVLQPKERREGVHVLRRRDVFVSEQPAKYNLTGDTVTDLDLDFGEDEPMPAMHVRPRNSDPSAVDYFRNVLPVTRPLSGVNGMWLEIAIVADHTMLRFHGRERVKHYILALMNIVSAIFNDSSLNSNMTLVINKLYLYEERDPVIRYGNVKKSLEAVNKWNYRHLMKLPPESTGWDAAVWLTRAQLGGPSGFAPVGGVCTRVRSAAINRDEGLTSAFVIAHELGHLLGLTHDGDGHCDQQAQRGTVMSPTVIATLHNYAWSSCSKRQFYEKFTSWWCLHERSQDEGVELGGARELSNYVFTMEEQCRMEFGDGYSVCRTVKARSSCSRLWCAHRNVPQVCRSKRAPPLEGTPCGHNYWCVDQVCEAMPGHEIDNKMQETPATPEWEEWGEWSQCSAHCGYGLRKRTRRCRHNGLPSEACEGAGSQVGACWAGAPCAALRDMRSDSCYRQDSRLIPHVHDDESRQCDIWCVDFAGGEASTFGPLPDGTSCSYNRPYDICFQGTCVKGQCNSSDPMCNWCPDGYCSNYTHVFHRHLGKGWTRMAVIPHDARQMSVHISSDTPLYIAIRERRREKHILELSKHHSTRFEVEQQDKYLKYDPTVPQNLQIIQVDSNVIDIKEGWRGAAVAAGALVEWNQTDTDVFVTSASQLQTDLMIMAVPERSVPGGEAIGAQVSVNYSLPAGRARPLQYRFSTERGPCSVSCGGGVRQVRPRCLAHDTRCSLPRYERCNTHRCEFTWRPGEWEECSATCGDQGVQERQLFCVPLGVSTVSRKDLVANSVSPALCPSTKPESQQPCNRVHCPVYWRELPWTPCSTTCGRGKSHRPLVCPAEDEAYCGAKPRERHRSCRLRRCPPLAARAHPCPAVDVSQYCEVFTPQELQRNCVLPRFRKYCCNACRHADNTLKGNILLF